MQIGSFRTASIALSLAALGACSTDNDAPDLSLYSGPSNPAPGPEGGTSTAPDAPSNPSGTTIVVTTALESGANAGTFANVNLVAWRESGGSPWAAAKATAKGKYSFAVKGTKYSVAIVCGSGDGKRSYVRVYERTTASAFINAQADAPCQPIGALDKVEYKSSGSVGAAGGAASVVFGGPRGLVATSAVALTGASYAVGGVPPGTWDLGFGLPGNATNPVARILFSRAQSFAGDKTVNIDFAGGFVPGKATVTVTGLKNVPGADESVNAAYLTMRAPARAVNTTVVSDWAAGLPLALNVGPTKMLGPQFALTFATVPAALQGPDDNHQIDVVSYGPGAQEWGKLSLRRKFPTDQTVALPTSVGPVTATAAPATSSVGFMRPIFTWSLYPAATKYTLMISQVANAGSEQRWFSFDVDADTLSPTNASFSEGFPDLTGVAGWDDAWGFVAGPTSGRFEARVETSTANGVDLRVAGRAVAIP